MGLERSEEEDPQKRPFRGPNNWPSELPELKEVRGPGGRDMYIDAQYIYIYLFIYIYICIYPMDPSAFLGSHFGCKSRLLGCKSRLLGCKSL